MKIPFTAQCFALTTRIALLIVAFLILQAETVFCAAGPGSVEKHFDIIVIGIDGEVRDNVEAVLVIPRNMVRNGHVERTWARRFARQAPAHIKRAMEPFGYYHPQISAELVRHDNGSYTLKASINPGDPTTISKLSLSITGDGADETRLQNQIEAFPLKEGEPLRHRLYEESKGILLATATSLGYLDARYRRHEILVDSEKRQAEIYLHMETGSKYYFGEVKFSGADNYPEFFLKRFQTFSSGETFSRTEMAKTQANLLDADKFRFVKVAESPVEEESLDVPVLIELVPLPRYQLRPGIGYGTDTGARTSLRFKDINSFHLGHEFLADLLIAELRQTLSSQYLMPLTSRSDSLLAFSAKYDRESNDIFESSSLSTEASLTHGLPQGFKVTFFLNLSQENYKVGNEPKRNTSLIMPGVRIGQRHWKFERQGQVRQGYAWQMEARGSSVALGSDVSLLQGMAGGSAVLSLPWENKLIMRAEAGTTLQNEFDDLPPSMRFFAGGDQSVRGYGFKNLGPKDSSGDVIGGRHLLVGSLEIERPINKDWSYALFYDAGNAFDSFSDYKHAEGAGVGFRRYTPIGPIKVDLARQVDGRGNDYRIHLSVGFGW